ncbi:MAG: hypothetical protein JOZ90_09820 [Alphaproteobacteria bacterium]|nr:hypothetical protein [Alphaproteobacteria bacterium]MBV9372393.1 hypothetical protein [Alphaproteobacteria bacterium]MBV9901381.1 hypothetical protein [Alphaproteobacteria bacterium]
MKDDAAFLRAQAKKCRWLAQRINSQDVIDALLEMAGDYDRRAAEKESAPPQTPPS